MNPIRKKKTDHPDSKKEKKKNKPAQVKNFIQRSRGAIYLEVLLYLNIIEIFEFYCKLLFITALKPNLLFLCFEFTCGLKCFELNAELNTSGQVANSRKLYSQVQIELRVKETFSKLRTWLGVNYKWNFRV